MSIKSDANRVLIDGWLQVSLEKKAVALELARRARKCATLSPRQRQLLPEIVDHSLSALELLSAGWTKRQALWTGGGARSLYEASVVASYVVGSEVGAERFYQDGLIDIRDIFESLDAQSSDLGDLADFKELVGMLRAELSQLMAVNQISSKARHLTTSEIADEIGAKAEHKLVYQFLSKFSHSSSVTVLTRNGEIWLSMILPLLAWIGLKEYMLMLARIADGLSPQFVDE
jgi:hypothetical protein